MAASDFSALVAEITKRGRMVKAYILEQQSIEFAHAHLQDSVYSYVKAGGKGLRPAVLMMACGAVGGDENHAIPAAAAVELYHTFTLVHDDIIDRDELRRGVPTVHVDFARRATQDLGFDEATAQHYGLSLAILAGDVQQGWAASTLPALFTEYGVAAELVINLVAELFRRIQLALINGETFDILLSQTPINSVDDQQVLAMLWQKTGILYEFCGRAGAAIGLNQPDLRHPTVEAVAQFTGKCGVAFQIQDDILGIVGKEEQLGKPVGSDLREGKRTLIVTGSWRNMTPAQQTFALTVLGNPTAEAADIEEMNALLHTTGGIDHARQLAHQYIAEAREHLAPLPDTEYKHWLNRWADFIIEREF